MSWSEIFKINNNMKRTLNEQMRDLKFQEVQIITNSQAYTPNKNGLYKVICVGAGGDGSCGTASNTYGAGGGGGGGVAIKTVELSTDESYEITIGTTASFAKDDNTIITATSGGAGSSTKGGSGGVASGGDNNYPGIDGSATGGAVSNTVPQAGGVGVYLSNISDKSYPVVITLKDYNDVLYTYNLPYGNCLLNYGGGGTGVVTAYSYSSGTTTHATTGKPAAVLIVPVEMEG